MSDTNNRVQTRHWIWLAALATSVWLLSSMYAEKSMGAAPGESGWITEDTHLCHTSVITTYTIASLNHWAAVIKRLESVGGDVNDLGPADLAMGNRLFRWCSTLSEGYPVVLDTVEGDYALVRWARSLDFGDYTFIIRLHDFQAGGLRL